MKKLSYKDALKMRKWARSDQYWWARLYWRTRKGNRLNFRNRDYLKDIYRDRSQKIVIKKAAQMGLSEYAGSRAFFVGDTLNGNTLYTFPAEKQMSEHVRGRIDPVIEHSSYISSLVQRGERTGASKASDNVGMKRVADAYIYFRGAQNSKQITSVDADQVIVDEFDRYGDVSKSMLEKRVGASDLKWFLMLSTPTLEDVGIDAEYNISTKHRYLITCTACKRKQDLDFWQNVDQDAVKLVCASLECRKEFTVKELNSGIWTPDNPNAEIKGYHVTSLYSPTVDLKGLIDASKSQNETKLQEFYNQDLGLAYAGTDRRIADNVIQACEGDYALPYPIEGLSGVWAGCDVGKPSWLVIGKNIKDPSTGNTYPRIIGFFEIHDLEQEIPHYMQTYRIARMVIDGMPEITLVNRLVNKFPGRIFAAEYNYNVVDANFAKWYDRKVLIHRTGSLDELFGKIYSQTIEFPKNSKYIKGLYDHLKNQKRIEGEIRGMKTYIYVDNGKPDHYAHSLNYGLIASTAMPGSFHEAENRKREILANRHRNKKRNITRSSDTIGDIMNKHL